MRRQISCVLAAFAIIEYILLKNERIIPDGRFTHFHSSPATTNFTPPFHTSGRHILDANEEPIKLASMNWYGASDIGFVPSGLDVQHRDDIAQLIKRLGFNSVRLPYADEIVVRNPVVNSSLISANADLFTPGNLGKPLALEVFHAVVESLTAVGLMVIVNNHITQAT